MPSILERILADTRVDVERRKDDTPLGALRSRIAFAPQPRDFQAALAEDGISLIAEFKRASPSKGEIRPGAVPSEIAKTYAAAGARAMSVLTNQKYFEGSDDDLVDARGAVELPVLRKDFIIDEYQIYEARCLGADAVLLIAAALSGRALVDFIRLSGDIGLTALVETHSEDEVDLALEAGASIIGINNRDLTTFETTLETTERLRVGIPPGPIIVSESGIHTVDDMLRLRQVGVDAVLVGESLMRSTDIGAHVGRLLGAS